ncbi:MAG: acyl-CoA synthetase, partial [Candidatus Thermoplasmatota archaeon]|nr:acyl-CoA synthetase [Candidatus Thermoplasmatota archaeon]
NSVVVHSDAVIIIGGSAGTLSEIAMAWSLYRLIIGFRVEGWSGKLADKTVDDRDRYPEIENDRVYGVDDADEALALLKELLPKYQKVHRGIQWHKG